MSRAADLRMRATHCRRMASVPTAGGHHEDAILLAVADQLEREAAELDRRVNPAGEDAARGRLGRAAMPHP